MTSKYLRLEALAQGWTPVPRSELVNEWMKLQEEAAKALAEIKQLRVANKKSLDDKE